MCIISWGAFNEPRADFGTQEHQERDTICTIDTLRKVYVGRQPWMTPDPDCDNVDIVSGENSKWNNRWSEWNQIINLPWIAGGFTWVFNDYTGFDGSHFDRQPHGMVDMMRVPKVAYFGYREKYLGIPSDNPVSGTATKIDLNADVTSLDADGSDVSLISVTLRNDAGACINVLKDIQFTVTGPATLFGSTAKKTVEGRINALIKSTFTAGQICVTAKCSGLPDATVSLISQAITDSLDPSKPFVSITPHPVVIKNQAAILPLLRQNKQGFMIDF